MEADNEELETIKSEAARAARQPGVSGRRGRRRQHPQVEAAKGSRQVLGGCGCVWPKGHPVFWPHTTHTPIVLLLYNPWSPVTLVMLFLLPTVSEGREGLTEGACYDFN